VVGALEPPDAPREKWGDERDLRTCSALQRDRRRSAGAGARASPPSAATGGSLEGVAGPAVVRNPSGEAAGMPLIFLSQSGAGFRERKGNGGQFNTS